MNASDQRRLTPVLMIGCVLFAVLLAALLAGWGRSLKWTTGASAEALPPAVQGTRSVDPAPLEHFAEIWQRPLFNADRRPAVAKPTPNTDTANLNDFELTGIILTPSLRMALVLDRGSNHTQRLREGDALPGGWTLDVLEARRAVFKQGGRRTELLLPLTPSADADAMTGKNVTGATTTAVPPKQSASRPAPPVSITPSVGNNKSVQDARIQALKARIEQRRRQQQSSHGVR